MGIETTSTEETKTTTYVTVVKVTCDMCGKECPNPAETRYEGGQGNWSSKGSFNFHHTIVREAKGSSYPEGGSEEAREADVCPECMDMLFKIIESRRNVPARDKESEW